jgi:hypothetical protein
MNLAFTRSIAIITIAFLSTQALAEVTPTQECLGIYLSLRNKVDSTEGLLIDRLTAEGRLDDNNTAELFRIIGPGRAVLTKIDEICKGTLDAEQVDLLKKTFAENQFIPAAAEATTTLEKCAAAFLPLRNQYDKASYVLRHQLKDQGRIVGNDLSEYLRINAPAKSVITAFYDACSANLDIEQADFIFAAYAKH